MRLAGRAAGDWIPHGAPRSRMEKTQDETPSRRAPRGKEARCSRLVITILAWIGARVNYWMAKHPMPSSPQISLFDPEVQRRCCLRHWPCNQDG